MKKYIKDYLKEKGLDISDILYCEECGAVASDLHHIKFKSQGGTDNPKNLKPLCRKHHAEAHGIKIK